MQDGVRFSVFGRTKTGHEVETVFGFCIFHSFDYS